MNQGMPIVMFDRVVSEIKCDKVIVDDFNGAKNAVEKLISNQCKTIALITTKDYVSVGKLRTQGYLEALQTNKITPQAELILKMDDTLDYEVHLKALESEIEQLFKAHKNIDVLIQNPIFKNGRKTVDRSIIISIGY